MTVGTGAAKIKVDWFDALTLKRNRLLHRWGMINYGWTNAFLHWGTKPLYVIWYSTYRFEKVTSEIKRVWFLVCFFSCFFVFFFFFIKNLSVFSFWYREHETTSFSLRLLNILRQPSRSHSMYSNKFVLEKVVSFLYHSRIYNLNIYIYIYIYIYIIIISERRSSVPQWLKYWTMTSEYDSISVYRNVKYYRHFFFIWL